jgi:hypothetical protein
MCIGTNQSPKLQQQTRKRGRKAVRFQSSKNLCSYHEGLAELTEQMILDMWCQEEDFFEFRRAAASTCKDAIQKGHASFIKRTYGHSDLKTQACLDLWAKLKDTKRGLERFIDRDHATLRHYIRSKQIKGVLYAQKKLTKDGVTGRARRAGIIRKVATTASEDAVIFATMLGSADQTAVELDPFMKEGSSRCQSTVANTKVSRRGLQLYLERQSKGLEDNSLKDSCFISSLSPPSRKKNMQARIVDLEAHNSTFLFQVEGNPITLQIPTLVSDDVLTNVPL